MILTQQGGTQLWNLIDAKKGVQREFKPRLGSFKSKCTKMEVSAPSVDLAPTP